MVGSLGNDFSTSEYGERAVYNHCMRSSKYHLGALGVLVFLGCASSRSLLVKMYNPKTNTTLNCSAREGTVKDVEALYDAVEACVRQLEAQGFIRLKDSAGPESR